MNYKEVLFNVELDKRETIINYSCLTHFLTSHEVAAAETRNIVRDML